MSLCHDTLIIILGVCLSATKEDVMKYIVYYLETNFHLLDKASEKVSLAISEHNYQGRN